MVASYCVAVLSAYALFALSARLETFGGARQWSWLILGALALGSGVWSLHHAGLHAEMIGAASPGITLLSWLTAAAVSALMLYVCSRPRFRGTHLLIGGLLAGLGYCMMDDGPSWFSLYDHNVVLTAALIATAVSAFIIVACFALRDLPLRWKLPSRLGVALILGGVLGVVEARIPARYEQVANHGHRWAEVWTRPAAGGFVVLILLLSLLDAYRLERRRHQRHQQLATQRLQSSDTIHAETERHHQLPGRSAFEAAIGKELTQLPGQQHLPIPAFSLVYVDVQEWKPLKDHLGRKTAEMLLAEITRRLRPLVRTQDVLARIAPAGFAILIRDGGLRTQQKMLSSVESVLTPPLLIDQRPIPLQWGMGASRFPDAGDEVQALMDVAMRLHHVFGDRQEPSPLLQD